MSAPPSIVTGFLLLAFVHLRETDSCAAPVQVDEALGVLREMVSRGCERNTVTYAALVAACERARRPAAARELFAEMQREGVKPNVSIYNSVISACSQSELASPPAAPAAAKGSFLKPACNQLEIAACYRSECCPLPCTAED